MTLSHEDVVPLFLAAVPSFQAVWDGGARQNGADDEWPGRRLDHVDAAAVARHAVRLLADGEHEEAGALLTVVERLLVEGEPYVRNLATTGHLESLQGAIERHPTLTSADVLPLLGPESRLWWLAVERFWSGRSQTVSLRPEDLDEDRRLRVWAALAVPYLDTEEGDNYLAQVTAWLRASGLQTRDLQRLQATLVQPVLWAEGLFGRWTSLSPSLDDPHTAAIERRWQAKGTRGRRGPARRLFWRWMTSRYWSRVALASARLDPP